MSKKPRIVNNLDRIVAQKRQKAATAMTKALVLAASEASVLTPIDTSTLLNSQTREVEFAGDSVVGRVRYTADYAKYVHDPKVKQNFRRSTAEKEFLRKGFERNKERIQAILAKGMK